MPATFLGKWRIYIPALPALNLPDGYAAYSTEGEYEAFFCRWYVRTHPPPAPPAKVVNIAFLLRADGQLCLLLNNGQYVGYQSVDYEFSFVSTLESATGFAFPGHNPQSLPTPFTGQIQHTTNGTLLICTEVFGQYPPTAPAPPSFTMTQVTPTFPSIMASGTGNGLDFAWVDLTDTILENISFVEADFSHCDLTNARFTNVNFTGAVLTHANLSGATFSNCTLDGAFLTNCTLTNTDFTGSTLLGTHLDGATFNGTVLSSARLAGAIFKQADLTNVMASPLPHFYNTPLTPPSPTNPRTTLAGCRLNQSLIASDWTMLDLTGATILNLSSPLSSATEPLQASYSILKGLNNNSLVGLTLQSAVFNNTVLDGLVLSGADLTGAFLIEASLHGTMLINVTLAKATLTGAQLGTLGYLFTLPSGSKTALNEAAAAAITPFFTQHSIMLSPEVTLNTQATDRVWALNDVGNHVVYTIRLEAQADSTQVLTVYAPALAASLSDAYMPDAVLTGANLYGVIANNIQFYGSGAHLDSSANLEEAQLNSSNLSNLNLTQARLLGTNLSGAYLFNARFNGANLMPSASGVAASLSDANLQGADFTDAQLYGGNLANAAVAINVPTTAFPQQGGVYLFSLPDAGDSNSLQQYTSELDAAAKRFSLNPNGDAPTLQKYVSALEDNNLALLKIAFLEQQPPVILSANAQIETIEVGGVWQIVDGQKSYTLWTDLGESGEELYAAPSLTKTRAAFQQNDITLRWQASAVDEANQQWLLDNDSENPQNFSTGYMSFLLKLNGSVLDVYGTALRIVRLGANNQEEYDTETCNVTVLSVTNMDGSTICPNGVTLSVNQAQTGATWDERWLRASAPPKPPTCVPTLYHWCPPTPTQTHASNKAPNGSKQ